jgi:hypothetical protein
MWVRSTAHALAAASQAACVQALRQLAVAAPTLVAETLHNLFHATLDADLAPSTSLSDAIAEVRAPKDSLLYNFLTLLMLGTVEL